MSTKSKINPILVVLGPEGSSSHEASIQYDKNIQPIFFDTIGGIIDAIANRIYFFSLILAVFKDNNVNLVKLESRTARNKLGFYIFYMMKKL